MWGQRPFSTLSRCTPAAVLMLLLCMLAPARAADPDSCLFCHEEDTEVPVAALMQTPHAALADERTRFDDQGCANCHGDPGEHRQRPGRVSPAVTFDASKTPATEQNDACLACHQSDGGQMHWPDSNHAFGDVSCASCHRIHHARDPALQPGRQPELCGSCHQHQVHEFRLPSRHPVSSGQMACTDCHDPHGSTTPSDLVRPTLNQTCHQCHAEVRGPLLWEHPPVQEDCTLCHRPHGSPHQGLLELRTPQLCQQCHLGPHADDAFGRDDVDDYRVMGRDCMNCHSRVHGSNHPRGSSLQR